MPRGLTSAALSYAGPMLWLATYRLDATPILRST